MTKMIKIPKKLNVKGSIWSVKITDVEDFRGMTDFDTRQITIDKKLSSKEQRRTFFHELFHATLHEVNIYKDSRNWNQTLEEIVVANLADIMMTLLYKKK